MRWAGTLAGICPSTAVAAGLILDPEAEFDGVTANAVIGQVLLDTVPPSQRESA